MRKIGSFSIVLLAMALGPGCAAVYPEIKTPTREPVVGQPLDPPPSSLKWVAIQGATVPRLTRDGRSWGALGSTEPSSYAIISVNGAELFRTGIEAKTFSPTWPDAPRGNFPLTKGDRLRVELWESRPMHDRPIGIRELVFDGQTTDDDELRVFLEGGAELVLKIAPAKALVGLGFRYELRGVDGVFITQVESESPAGRAGLRQGDRIVAIDAKPTKGMSTGEIRSLLNMNHPQGLVLQLGRADGSTVALTLKAGAVYSLYEG